VCLQPITNCLFDQNTAAQQGGAIFFSDSQSGFDLLAVNFTANTVSSRTLSIPSSSPSGSTASSASSASSASTANPSNNLLLAGAALWLRNLSSFSARAVRWTDNHAIDARGGAAFLNNVNVLIVCLF
jgi:predicted outer membrane repeat protein